MIGMGLIGGFFIILVISGVIALAEGGERGLIESDLSNSPSNGEEVSARGVLDRRYAGGEISGDEYKAIKQDLME